MKKLVVLLTLPLVFTFGCTKEDLHSLFADQNDHNARKSTIVQHADLMIFQAAGGEGGNGNVLSEGDEFPPTKGSKATLKRGKDYIQFNLHTTGLPEGAYTIWYAIFNDPSSCSDNSCGENDLMLPTTGVVWATGKVVKANGVGNFSDRLYVGERREPGTQEIIVGRDIESPLSDPQGAEVHFIVKYHGLASDDPEVLKEQLYTFTGNCGPDDGANSILVPGLGYQCFDPQAAVFPAP